jgi:hypothetical protein
MTEPALEKGLILMAVPILLHRRREPSVDQLYASPELATLATLEMAADMAVLALAAVHPDIQDRDREPGEDTASVRAALAVIDLARSLGDALGRYRRALRRDAKRDSDMPF